VCGWVLVAASGLCLGLFVWSAAGANSPVQGKQTRQIDLYLVAEPTPLL